MTCLILCYYSFSTALCLTVFFKTHILQYVKCTLFFIYEKSHLLIFQPVFLTFFLKTYRLVCRLYSFVCVYHNTPYALDLHDYKLSSRKFKSPEKISLSNRLFHVRAACKSHFVLFGFACVKSALRIALSCSSGGLFHVRAACKSHFVLFGFACVKSALRIAPLVLFGRIVMVEML